MGIMTNYANAAPTVYAGVFSKKSKGREISRLITAAVVNKGFCQMLLKNPRLALDSGYKGESFAFESEEQDFILSIRASNLAEFANQLTDRSWEGSKRNDSSQRRKM
jgi:hypothetical protein